MKSLKLIVQFSLLSLMVMLVGKLVFVLWNPELSLRQFPAIYGHGLLLDLSVLGYLLLPVALTFLILGNKGTKVYKYYSLTVWTILFFIACVDALSFRYWKSKINLMFSLFMDDPGAGWGSMLFVDRMVILGLILLLILSIYLLVNRWVPSRAIGRWWSIPLIGLSVILARGGFNKIPIGLSAAFWSQEDVLNNASLNPVWNLVAYEFDQKKAVKYELLPETELEKLMVRWREAETPEQFSLKLNDSARVIFIILESFTNKENAQIYSGMAVNPNLDRLAEEGISFQNAYASSFRSDRGLAAMFTGIPSFIKQNLTNRPEQLDKAPNLIRIFKQQGWYTSFFHGGKLDYANMRLLVDDADALIEQSQLPEGPENSWGVHDEIAFREFVPHLIASPRPSFNCLYSLSSHEPFEVPNYQRLDQAYLNSISYTDSCLGVLVNALKAEGEWSNSLLIITADHGINQPEGTISYKAVNYHVPLILAGGLLAQQELEPMQITEIVSQLDIPQTLVEALGLTAEFPYSKSLTSPSGIAFMNYYNGVTMVTDSCVQYYDISTGRYLDEACGPPMEQAFFQSAQKYLGL